MEISVAHLDLAKLAAPALLIPTYEDDHHFDPYAASLDEFLNGTLSRLADAGEVSGKFREFVILHPEKISISHLILLGAGKRKDFTLDRVRAVAAKGGRIARRLGAETLAFPVGSFLSLEPEESAAAAVEGLLLGLYRFKKYKNGKPDPKEGLPKQLLLLVEDLEEVGAAERGAERGKVLAEATNYTRDLVNEPSNMMTPALFAREAESVAREAGIEIEVLDKSQIETLGMGAFLSVAKGSREEPKLIILKYSGGSSSAFTLGLVGKGVTFDSGGISIKPAENMHMMTGDMAGAAACLGALKAIAALRVPVNVVAVLPLAENLPGGNAYKPGDIVRSYSGKTIEVLNTDAEGRLLLADALSYISKMPVNAVIDLATLTGGVVVALGHIASGVFCAHPEFLEEIVKAGEEASEPLWRLPLFDEYRIQVTGSLADLKNAVGRYGSPCTAAAFLREFVGEVPWAHVDIAGTALVESDKTPYQQKPYLPKSGATGVGVRTLTHLAERLSQRKEL